MYDVAVIGCGIVGAVAAFELSKYNLKIAVLEKNSDIAAATTKANSGILHAGYDAPTGSLMASLNVRGNRLAAELCADLDVPSSRCGSLVLAFSAAETKTLDNLYKRGISNGVPQMEIINAARLRTLEPKISREAVAALRAPTAMIVSPWEYGLALAETALRNGAELFLQTQVSAIDRSDDGWHITTNNGDFFAKTIINAAGVHSDLVHNMAAEPDFKIIPDRGEYYLLDKSEGNTVNHVVFQCPTKLGKGILVSPTVHGNLLVGPNNEDPGRPEDTATTREGLAEIETLARRSIPDLNLRANIRNFSGIRAAADQDDFIIREAAPGFIDLAGIKSPGLTAAPAIAEMAAQILKDSGLEMIQKADFISRRKRVRFAELSPEEKTELVSLRPDYGRIICRCESITEGEILDALSAPIPPRSVNALKRRCNAGMGRCQGGFCGPRITRLLAEFYGVSPLEVLQENAGSEILAAELKRAGGAK